MNGLRQSLERTRGGNKNSFAEVMVLFQDMAMAVAMRHLGNRALAEEAVQDAFALAWLKLSGLKELDAFPGWFRTILLRCCQRVKSRNFPFAPLTECDALAADIQNTDPYTIVTRNLDLENVRTILNELGEPYREASLQRFVYGRSYKEIAACLGLPVGTLKRRIHDVRERVITNLGHQAESSVRIGCMPISDHLLLMAAHHWYNDRVFRINLHKYLSWSSLVHALNTHLLDAALIMAPLAMALFNNGMPIRHVLDCHHDGSAITVREDAHQSMRSGGVMALPHQLSTHRMLLQMFYDKEHTDRIGMPPHYGFTQQYISPSYVIGSLQQHKIDGFFCSEPWSTKSVAQGIGRIVARSKDLSPGHSCCILVIRESFIQHHGQKLESFLKLLEETGKQLSLHPAEGARILKLYTGVDLGTAEHVLCNRHITFSDLRPDMHRTTQFMRLALETGVLTRPCDLRAFMGI